MLCLMRLSEMREREREKRRRRAETEEGEREENENENKEKKGWFLLCIIDRPEAKLSKVDGRCVGCKEPFFTFYFPFIFTFTSLSRVLWLFIYFHKFLLSFHFFKVCDYFNVLTVCHLYCEVINLNNAVSLM